MTRSGARRLKLIICYILVVIICAIFIVPFLWMIRSALMDMRQLNAWPVQILPNPIVWNTIPDALSVRPFGMFFRNTLILTVANVTGAVLTTAMAGYAFARLEWRGRNIIFFAILSSMMIPGFVTLIPTFLIWSQLGFINTFVPLILPAWMGGGAFGIFLVRQFFLTIPKELDEAALIDGANQGQIFWRILLPLIKPVLAVLAIFSFMGTWGDFMGPLVYLIGARHLHTLALGLAGFIGPHGGRQDWLMAASAVVTMPMILVFFFFQRYFIEGVTLTGIKG